MEMELHGNARALGHLTEDQRRRLDALDASYIDLMSSGTPAKADVEALAEAVVAFYDGLAKTGVGHENGA
ncbi:hypothetical protein [Agrobacterium sp. SORGH_AS 787]|uniref:hypothetical protein n=1 Tax=Agrobacterium sp. SORGH_AS 787 TaxID=3041775 RepID=UPI0027871BCC|nr:hypothetical protein [Rhizobium sp. SORGH_AS_0787]